MFRRSQVNFIISDLVIHFAIIVLQKAGSFIKQISNMSLRGISIFWLLAVGTDLTRGNRLNIPQNKVCIKERTDNHEKPFIDTKTSDFKVFVSRSNIFVDKSLLVKSIVEDQPLISLTYPRKWGKSITLNMVKTFLEIEFDYRGNPIPVNNTWSYSFFKQGVIMDDDGRSERLTDPPMIADHHHIIDKYLARHPVIHIDLSSNAKLSIGDFTSYFDSFRNIIATAFKKYNFIVNVLRDRIDDLLATKQDEKLKLKEQLKKFKMYKQATINDRGEMMKSLAFLSTLLHQHFGCRVFVFIDNYDAPIQLGYFNYHQPMGWEEARKFMDFFADLMTTTFMTDEHIVKGVLTGVLSLDVCTTPILGMNHAVNYNALKNNLYPFYGFTTLEVDQLLKSASFSEDFIERVLDKYSGYHMLNFPDVTIYNPQSIVNVVRSGKIDDDWCRDICLEKPYILPRIVHHEKVQEIFLALISQSIDAKMKRRDFTLHREDILSLNKMIRSDEAVSLTRDDVALILIFHFATGYVTLDFHSIFTNWNEQLHIKIPCVQVERIIVKELERYYGGVLGDVLSTPAKSVANEIIRLVQVQPEPFNHTFFDSLYYTLFESTSFISNPKLLDTAHCFVVLYIRSSSNFEYNVGLNATYSDDLGARRTPLIVVYGKGNGMVYGFYYVNSTTVLSVPDQKAVHNKLKEHQSYYRKKSVNKIYIISALFSLQHSPGSIWRFYWWAIK